MNEELQKLREKIYNDKISFLRDELDKEIRGLALEIIGDYRIVWKKDPCIGKNAIDFIKRDK